MIVTSEPGREGGRRGVQDHLQLHCEFEARLDLKLCLKQLHTKTWVWQNMTVTPVLKLFRAILGYVRAYVSLVWGEKRQQRLGWEFVSTHSVLVGSSSCRWPWRHRHRHRHMWQSEAICSW